MNLVEQTIVSSNLPLSQRASSLIEAGRGRFDDISCFGFVPSDYEAVWRILDAMERGRFVEWGSGFGITTALAEMLGFDATGVERESELVDKSRKLLSEFELTATIEQGDYLMSPTRGDIYFVYCWPGMKNETQQRFAEIATPDDKLFFCEGHDDIRCRMLG